MAAGGKGDVSSTEEFTEFARAASPRLLRRADQGGRLSRRVRHHAQRFVRLRGERPLRIGRADPDLNERPGPSIAVGNFPTASTTATNATTPLAVLDQPGAIAISPTTGQAWV